MDYQIFDDCLNDKDFQVFRYLANPDPYETQVPESCPADMDLKIDMHYNGTVSEDSDKSSHYFVHLLYQNFTKESPWFDLVLDPLIRRFSFYGLLRGKINWYPQTRSIIEHGSHLDMSNLPRYKNLLVYANDNDGFTRLSNPFGEDVVIESKANRVVIFDGGIHHNSTTCTDAKMRCTVNFNFVEM